MDNFNLLKKAESLFIAEEYHEAEKLYESSSNLIENRYAIHCYGMCLVNLGKYDKAIDVFCEITNKYPYYGKAWYSLGRTYLIKGNTQQAIECFTNTKNILHDDADVYFYSALCYELLKNYDKAINDYKMSLNLNNGYQTHMNLGLCYYDLGNLDLALKHTREAFNLNPNDLDTLRYYVYILIKLNKKKEAYNVLLNSTLCYDGDATILELLVLLALDNKNYDIADKTYIKLKKIENESSEPFDYSRFKKIAQNNLGDVFEVK